MTEKRAATNQVRQERRARYLAEGRCGKCGKVRAESGPASDRLCAECARKEHERRVAWKTRKRAEAEKLPAGAVPEPEARSCPFCGGSDLRADGHNVGSGRYRYLCKSCGRLHSGIAPLPPRPQEVFECPNVGCNGTCFKHGRDPLGRQKYCCRVCGRINTDLYPYEPRGDDGPYPHLMKICLSLKAEQRLTEYCFRERLTEVAAVRRIFREMADEPRRPMAVGGRPRIVLPEPREAIPSERPDLRAETTRARNAAGGKLHYSVLVTRKLTVMLDDRAYQGLLRFMRKTGLNHQAAARMMIVQTG